MSRRSLSSLFVVGMAATLSGFGSGCDGEVTPVGASDGMPGGDVGVPRDLSATTVDLASADLSANPTDGPPGDIAAPTGDLAMLPINDLGCFTDLAAITVSTTSPTMVTLDGKTATPINFTVTGTFKNGKTMPIDPSTLKWSATRADDTPPGTINNGVLTPNPGSGGTVTVSATDGCVTGSATITFNLQVVVGPMPPPGFGNPPVSTGAPTIVYPSAETRFPRNIYRTLFQWRTNGFTQFRLTFEGPGAKVTVITDGNHALCANKTPAAGCWEADETAWSYIAGSNAGATVTWTLDALDNSTNPPTVRRATPINIGFSRRDVLGAIFYWSTTSAGIRRANIADAQPEDYITGKPGTVYPSPNGTVQCVACHTVSRDGKYLLAPVQSSGSKGLWITEVTKTAPPNPLVTNIANTGGHGFATISPDDSTVVAAWNGTMWTVDRATGKFGANLPLGGTPATHPDWSPDNTQLVFATASGDAPSGASIAVIPWLNPGWGVVKPLVPANGLSNLFPMFSPDGKYIAFSRGKGGHGDLTAQLNLVPAAGGMPTELVNCNRVVSNQMTTGQFENSQPTWAPSGDFDWIAFNSVREYGVVSPKGTQQIWVAAIDKSKEGTGMDPSFPAFRLQFQGLAENNHRAFWTLDVRQPPPIPDGGMPPDMASTDLAVPPPDLRPPPPPDLLQPPPDLLPPPPDMWHCIPSGQMCDPVFDTCCNSTDICDTTNNGMTYTCIPKVM